MSQEYIFNEKVFVTPDGVGKDCENPDSEEYEQVENIRTFNNELSHWGGLAIYFAIGSYSQDIMAVSWGLSQVEILIF